MDYKYQTTQGEIKSLTLTPEATGEYSVTIGEKTYAVQVAQAENGSLLLHIDGRKVMLHIARAGNQFHVAYAGQVFAFEKSMGSSRAAIKTAHAGDLTATMPGQVIKVLVVAGEPVEKGQTLIILEAMKMEMRVKAPYAGVVKQLLCAAGDTVDRGQLLAEVAIE